MHFSGISVGWLNFDEQVISIEFHGLDPVTPFCGVTLAIATSLIVASFNHRAYIVEVLAVFNLVIVASDILFCHTDVVLFFCADH